MGSLAVAPAAVAPVAAATRLAAARRVAGDAVAVAVLAVVLWSFAGTDGGIDLVHLARSGALLALALPVAAAELRYLPRIVALLLAAAGGAALLAVAAAPIRADFVEPAIGYGSMPVAALLAMRVWRRPWGPVVLAAILGTAFLRSWHDSFLAWVGSVESAAIQDRWLALSWHNQSAILMGAGGLVATAGAVFARSRVAAGLAAATAAAAFAATWLAGSRGGLAAVALGGVVLAAATRVHRPLRFVAVAVLTVAAVAVLTHLPGPETTGIGIAGKPLSAAESAGARLDHMGAAVEMFAARPLTGFGVGSYGIGAAPYRAPGTNPSTFAHNELLEPFAEGGVLFGGAVLALVAGLGHSVLRLVRRGPLGERGLRPGLATGSAAAVVALLAHAAIDFDWLYPLLAVGLGVLAGVVLAEEPPRARRHPGQPWWLAPVGVLLVLAVAASWPLLRARPAGAESIPDPRAPWQANAAMAVADDLLATADAGRAGDVIDAARAWNPGVPGLATYRAVIDLRAGTGDAAAVLATLDPADAGFRAHNLAARHLLAAGEFAAAGDVLDQVTAMYHARPGWNLGPAIDETLRLRITLAGEAGGCAAAGAAASAAAADPLAARMPVVDLGGESARFCR